MGAGLASPALEWGEEGNQVQWPGCYLAIPVPHQSVGLIGDKIGWGGGATSQSR